MKNKIILEGETEFQDLELREWVDKLFVKIETLNERTKRHTILIRELNKEIKKWKINGN